VYVTTSDGEGGGSRFDPCPVPPTCPAGEGAHWVDENIVYPGSPRRVSFVDDTTTQYRTYNLAIKHPFGGFGPNVVGTATITHADGRIATVPFNIPPGPGGFVDGPQYELGTSEGLPRPKQPRQPRVDSCTVAYLKDFPNFFPLLRASVAELAYRWRTGDRLLFNNVYACGKGKITGRVDRLTGGRKILVAKGTKILDYAGPGRAGTKLKLTKYGKKLKKARRGRFKVRATIGVYDSHGGKVIWSRKATLRN